MSVEVLWKLPLAGDGHSIRAERWSRGDYSPERRQPHAFARTGVPRDGYNYYDLLLQIARAAELSGFDGLWIPESPAGEDPLIVAGSLAREAPRLRLVPAIRPALLSAVYATKIAVSFQRLSGGRLAWHLVNDDSAEPRPWHGRRWPSSEQITRTSEFLDVARGFWHDAPFTYEGKFYEVVDGGFAPALQGETFPRVYLSGTTREALALSAKHADVHLFPLAPVAEMQERIAELDELARAANRRLRYGLETDLIARHTSDEAWSEARREWEATPPGTIAISPAVSGSVARPFEQSVHGEHLWQGFGRLRPGPALGLVGSYRELAEQLADYARVGVSTFALGAYPHLEGAYPIGEHLLPVLHELTREALPQAV